MLYKTIVSIQVKTSSNWVFDSVQIPYRARLPYMLPILTPKYCFRFRKITCFAFLDQEEVDCLRASQVID